MNFKKYLATLGMVLGLAACGGGGGSAGSQIGGSSGGGTSTPVASSFVFTLDKSSINNGGSDKALLTVTALDAANNVLSGVPVAVAVGSGFYTPVTSTSDATGQVTGNISIGSDKSNRTITATISVNGISNSKLASVMVTGSRILVTPSNATPSPGESISLNVSVYDSSNVVIPNVDVSLSGIAGLPGTVNTGVSGSKVVTFSTPLTPGSYSLIANGFNVTASQTITVIASANAIPNSSPSGAPSAKSLTPNPTSIAPNAAGATVNRSRLSAKFLTASNTGIQNMRVRFELVAPVLGNGESISTGVSTIYTDASGLAEADYIAGTRSSPTNGVTVRACYSQVDFTSATDCPAFVPANLTVAGAPLAISIGTDNTMQKGLGGIAYIKQFLIQVNDSAGVAVKDAVISASVDITHYGKGTAWGLPYNFVSTPSVRDYYSDFPIASAPKNALFSLQKMADTPLASDSTATPPVVGVNVWCVNEDWNRNGSLDAPEDINLDGRLQPAKAEIVVSYVSGNRTDASGQLLLQISYPQNMGGWLAYTLRATTSVAGSEGDASRSFVTGVIDTDVKNGSFLTPPYGSGSCTSPH